MVQQNPAKTHVERRTVLQRASKRLLPFADEMVADVPADILGCLLGDMDGLPGDVELLLAGAAGEEFHGAAVAIAGGEFLLRIDSGRVIAQRRLNEAGLLEEDAP